jgi:hypothetical protein
MFLQSSQDRRIALKNLAAQQLPEFVRAEYPTFVAFVEAYYEYLDNQGVDLKEIRDIDSTLEDYIKFFKAELAHNYPVVSTDTTTERFLLKHIKEQYLAKGSEASYKLLFRLLYGKDVFIDYPGRQMLRVSDGRWTQDVSIFVRVGQGDPKRLVGKTINIQTGKKIYNTDVVTGVDAFSGVVASVQNAVVVDEQLDIWELFLDRNFYGEISPNNTVKYGSEFSAVILPNTAKIKINDPGKNFRPGMVFQLNTGEGTPFWFKVATVTDSGGLKTIDVIRFGLFYNTSFSVTVLPGSAVSSRVKRKTTVSDLTYTVNSNGKIVDYKILSGGQNYTIPPLVEINGTGTGAQAHTIIDESGKVVEIVIDDFGQGYVGEVYAQVTNAPGDITGVGASLKPVIGSDYDYNFNDKSQGFTESGYVNMGDYWDASEHGRFAAATAIIHDNVITDITVTSQGQGYTTATVDITDSTGSGTTAEAIIVNGAITGITITAFGYNYTNPTITINGDGTGAEASAVVRDGCITGFTVTNGGSGYDLDPTIDINYPQANGVNIPHTGKAKGKANFSNGVITSIDVTYPGYGYTSAPIVKIVGSYGYANGGYVGTIARQFFINAQDTQGTDPAILNVSLDAVSKYPGYYKTNDGFLDDSMIVQDSYYYQAFAYVLKIDEQLQSYSSVVRSMLHPSGMAMFGEYSISNKIALGVGLQSLVKSLGVTLYDTVSARDDWQVDENGNPISGTFYQAYKYLETVFASPFAEEVKYLFTKSLADSVAETEVFNKIFTKGLGATGQSETVFATETMARATTKVVADSTSLVELFTKLLTTKSFTDYQPIGEQHAITFTLNTINDPMSGVFAESGYVTLDPYDSGSYQAEWYANTRPSTF